MKKLNFLIVKHIKYARITLILFFITNYNCQGQQMVRTIKDVYKLKTNEAQFINKPLKNLFQELKPEIKTAAGNIDNPFFFSFRFTTLEQQKKGEGSIDDRVSLYVYVKESFDWQWEKRPKGTELIWTKEDAAKYGDLIVVRIKVIARN